MATNNAPRIAPPDTPHSSPPLRPPQMAPPTAPARKPPRSPCQAFDSLHILMSLDLGQKDRFDLGVSAKKNQGVRLDGNELAPDLTSIQAGDDEVDAIPTPCRQGPGKDEHQDGQGRRDESA